MFVIQKTGKIDCCVALKNNKVLLWMLLYFKTSPITCDSQID